MRSVVFMFPGQSSRYPEMIEKLLGSAGSADVTRPIVRRASEILGRDLAEHYRATNPTVFARNRDVQVGVFLTNQLHLALLESAGVHAEWSLGSSLGEYNHLVHIGALTFEDALLLVDQRGRLYDEAEGGAMVALFPIDSSTVARAIEALGLIGRAQIGLYNSPRQQVLSGARAAVLEVAAHLVEAEEFLHTIEIEPRIPMHAAVFEPMAERLGAVLRQARLASPRRPYVPNVLGTLLESPSEDDIRACLTRHVHEAVRWQASVEAVAEALVSSSPTETRPCFIEVGPRSILHDLFGRGWTPRHCHRAKTDAPADRWPEHFDTMTAELANHAA